MLRTLVLLMLLANLGLWAWQSGWLAPLGAPAPGKARPGEPTQRAEREVQPERVSVVSLAAPLGPRVASEAPEAADAASSASQATSAPAPASPASMTAAANPKAAAGTDEEGPSRNQLCIEAGPFSSEDLAGVDRAMRSVKGTVPPDAWSRATAATGGQWMVYMGPYPDEALYARKVNELKRIRNLNFDEVRSPPNLAQGLSLGRFGNQADAETRLDALKQRGIRTARVVMVKPRIEQQWVRVPQATVPMQVALSGLKLPQGRAFTACRR